MKNLNLDSRNLQGRRKMAKEKKSAKKKTSKKKAKEKKSAKKKTSKKKAKKKASKKTASEKESKKSKGKKITVELSVAEKAILKELGKDFDTVGTEVDEVPYTIPFRHKGLQYITGGLAGGIFIEAHGPSQCGKSYLMMEGGMAYIEAGGWYLQGDIERAYKRVIGKKIGLEGHPRFAKTKERNMEKLFKKMEKFVLKIRKHDKHCPIFLGVDSFNPLQINETMLEIEKEMKAMAEQENKKIEAKNIKGYAAMRKNARFSDLMRDFIDFIEEHEVTFLLLNQLRKKHDVMFGDNKTTNADEIIQFYASLRLRGSLGAKIKPNKDSKKVIGRQVYWETVKSRHPDIPPFMKVMTEIIYKEGLREYSGLDELFKTEDVAKACKDGKFKALKFKSGDVVKLADLPAYVQEHPELLEYKD